MADPGQPLFANDVTRNPYVWGAVLVCLALIGIACYVPPLAASRRHDRSQQGLDCATPECCCRRKGGLDRPGSRNFRDSELVTRMGAQRIFGHQLPGNLAGEAAIKPALDIDRCL